jgi:hypothetical protein
VQLSDYNFAKFLNTSLILKCFRAFQVDAMKSVGTRRVARAASTPEGLLKICHDFYAIWWEPAAVILVH